jgi:hypothetical protein
MQQINLNIPVARKQRVKDKRLDGGIAFQQEDEEQRGDIHA